MTQLAISILREIRDLISATLPDQGDPTMHLVIDYPRERERIKSDYYCFRIGAGSVLKNVEVSISGGEWNRCRLSEGFWWYDWQNFLPGRKYLMVRATTPDDELIVTPPRRFTVRFR